MARTGRPCAITQEHDPLLVKLAQANPQSTLAELWQPSFKRERASVSIP